MERFKQKLQAAAIPFRENEPLAAHCTFKIGGPAQLFVMPENEQQLCSAVALCKEQAVRYYLLGNGSNILFVDEGFSGVVIDVSALDAEIAVEDTVLTAGAGVRLAALCKAALKHGLSGLEFAYGIPGTVGGAVYMNAGAYGGEMKDVVVSCRYITEKGDIKEIPLEKMELSYRHSFFSERNLCIRKNEACKRRA
jgi:UDP-N-acetylmuramate dehydrogenase